jgi:hypothetical protein
MLDSRRQRLSGQIGSIKKRFAQAEGLPFNDILSSDNVLKIVDEELADSCRDRIFPALVTLSAFLSQVVSPDPSCRDAVAKVIAQRLAQGEAPCSSDTGPYCNARQRLPENLVVRLVNETGQALHIQSRDDWKWKGRSVKLVDGTTVSMPDTPENQQEYPQPKDQKPGVGFPIARLVGVISLLCGAVLDVAIGPYQGKQTGEHALLRQILDDSLSAGDILLADRYYCSYFLIARLQQMGVDVVFQLHGSRSSDFRRGIKLGKKDHLVTWDKPKQRPDWMDEKTYDEMPDTLTVREIKSQGKVIVTTMLDPKQAKRKEIAALYTKRWLIEVDLRFIKTILEMDILRCKTPSMVRKEIWVHLLAYNLIRTVMAQAAYRFRISPRTLSFKGTIQLLNAFKSLLLSADEKSFPLLYGHFLTSIARHRVGNRPGRSEPRAVKRRPKSYPLLSVPRKEARKELSRKRRAA